MERQRGAGNSGSRQAKSATKSTGQPTASPPEARAKLSYKDVYALGILPDRIQELENTIEGCRKILEDPGLFKKDPDYYRKSADALKLAEAKLVQLEEQWLALEMKREEVEAS